MKSFTFVASLIACAALCGCASLSGLIDAETMAALDAQYQEWVASGQLAASISNYVANVSMDDIAEEVEDTVDPETPSVDGDMMDFSKLNWSFGGFNGAGAKYSEGQPKITGLNVSGNKMSYSWAGPDLSRIPQARWGYSPHDPGAIACLFVKNSAGQWVGGKFDWISSDRLTRGFNNINDGYHGWSLSGVPNPCETAFVIAHANGQQRSNVIMGTWQRLFKRGAAGECRFLCGGMFPLLPGILATLDFRGVTTQGKRAPPLTNTTQECKGYI